jgi:hypothetical protein
MQPDELLTTLKVMDAQHGYAARRVSVGTERIDRSEVEARLAGAWAEAQGWIARQSAVLARPRQADDPMQGAVLEAELTRGAETLQLRCLPGQWLATTVTEGDGEHCLSDEVVLVTIRDKAARYRRYWRLPADGAVTLIACRLIGFEEIPR